MLEYLYNFLSTGTLVCLFVAKLSFAKEAIENWQVVLDVPVRDGCITKIVSGAYEVDVLFAGALHDFTLLRPSYLAA